MSPRGLRLLIEWEGKRHLPYKDAAGLLTIGVGHCITKSELKSGKLLIWGHPVKYQDGLNEEQIEELLRQDLMSCEALIGLYDSVLNQHQYDALVSFVFNVGSGAFLGSTLKKRLDANQLDEVPAQLRRWVYAGGRKLQGLINRREKEIRLWEGSYDG